MVGHLWSETKDKFTESQEEDDECPILAHEVHKAISCLQEDKATGINSIPSGLL